MEKDKIRTTCEILGLPWELEGEAVRLFKKVVDTGSFRYYSNKERIAVSVIAIVCRQYRKPRTFAQIAKAIKVDRLRGIKRIACNITRKFGIKLPPIDAADFVPYFCAKLNLNKAIENKAIEIIKEAKKANVSENRRTASIAAAAIYIAAILCGDHRPQKEIADALGMTEMTIRNVYKEMAEQLDIEVIL